MRDEGGREAKVSLERVVHYLKISPRSASGGQSVLGSWVIAIYIFMPYSAGKRFEEIGK